jgi:hypothetical protein
MMTPTWFAGADYQSAACIASGLSPAPSAFVQVTERIELRANEGLVIGAF